MLSLIIMKLIITRHGETIENKEGITQGHLHGTLSELGKEQAKKVAERLKDEKIDFIYSSDLARASDTAKEIAKFHPNIFIEFVKDLRERFLGKFQGKKKSDLGLSKGESIAKIADEGEIESKKEMYQRAKNFLDKVINKHHNDTILFVTHNGIAKVIISVITNIPLEKILDMENLGNTSISIYKIDEDKNHKIHLFNCTKHLD